MKTLIVIALLSTIGCNAETRKSLAPTTEEKAGMVKYVKDPRTNLCFAVSWVSEYPIGQADIYSNVPCSPEVEKLVSK